MDLTSTQIIHRWKRLMTEVAVVVGWTIRQQRGYWNWHEGSRVHIRWTIRVVVVVGRGRTTTDVNFVERETVHGEKGGRWTRAARNDVGEGEALSVVCGWCCRSAVRGKRSTTATMCWPRLRCMRNWRGVLINRWETKGMPEEKDFRQRKMFLRKVLSMLPSIHEGVQRQQ